LKFESASFPSPGIFVEICGMDSVRHGERENPVNRNHHHDGNDLRRLIASIIQVAIILQYDCRARSAQDFGLWSVCFPPVLIRTDRRLLV
jgi:hypothetical protein